MTNLLPKRIFISANEASADLHGAKLARELNAVDSSIQISGVGSHAMQQAGVHLLMDLTQYSVIGIAEAIRHLKIYRQAFNKIVEFLREQKPDLIILIDAPAFNLPLAKKAKQLGIKVLYYISPQIWAWKSARIYKIRQYVDRMAVVFKFEEELYQHYQVPVTFVGHPLTATVKPTLSIAEAKKLFHLQTDSHVIGLLPGSRHNELKRLLPVMIPAIKQLANRYSNIEFILPVASTLSKQDILNYFPKDMPDIKLISGKTYDVINCCDTVISCSGTATLEIALFGKPMVIIYKVSPISYEIGARVIKVKHIGLPNLLANQTIVPELIQHDATANNIVKEISKFLDNEIYYQQVKSQLQAVSQELHAATQSDSVANVALEMLRLKQN